MKKLEKFKKDQFENLFDSFTVSKHASRFITGGYQSSTCLGTEVETMGDPNTFVDTPSDCGVDPDHCEDILVKKAPMLKVNFQL
jgi:hypothetical protein